MDSTRWRKHSIRDVGPYLLQYFPQLFQVGRMSFGWRTILDTHRKLLSVKNPAVLQFLTHHTPFKTHLNLLSYTIHVSTQKKKNPSLSSLLPFIYTSISAYSFHLYSPSESVTERAGVPNVLYTQCISCL